MATKKERVAKFIKVMTGGAVVIDGGALAARGKAQADARSIEDLRDSLAALSVSCRELTDMIQAYQTAEAAALAQPSIGQQDKLFVDVAADVRKAVVAAQALHGPYLAQAKRRQALVQSLGRQIIAQQGLLQGMAPAPLRAVLVARLKTVDQALSALLAVDPVEASALAGQLERLALLQTQLADADVERYVQVAAQLASQLADVEAAIGSRADIVAQMPKSRLRTLFDDLLTSYTTRLWALKQVTDLHGLVTNGQDLSDLKAEVSRLDLSVAGKQAAQYQKLMNEVLSVVGRRTQEIAALPSALLKTVLRGGLDDLEQRLVPIDRVASLEDLPIQLALLEDIRAELAVLDVVSQGAALKQYQDLLAQELAEFTEQSNEVDKLPSDVVRTPLKARLADLHRRHVPVDQLASLADLKARHQALQASLDQMKALEQARAYQESLSALHAGIQGKRDEIAALNLPVAQSLMAPVLDALEVKLAPLDQITEPDQFEEALRRVNAAKEQLEKMDIAAGATAAQERAQLLTDLPLEIDAKVTELAGHLSAGEQAALRGDFMRVITALKPVESLSQLDTHIATLQSLRASVQARKLKEPSPAQKKRFEVADAELAKAQKLVAGLPTPELQKAATEALAYLDTAWNQLKVNAPPQGLPGLLNVGNSAESGTTRVSLKASEHSRALASSLKALNVVFKDPASPEAKLLALEGGRRFTQGISAMGATLVAFGGNHREISPAEALAIYRYTGSDYSAMNRQRLGLEQDERLQFLNQTCDQALAKMPPYPEVAWPAFRAESAWSQEVVDKRYAKGRQFTTGVLWSTGARGTVDLSRSSPKFTHVIYGKSGRDVAALSANAGEGAMQERGYELNRHSGRGEVLFLATSVFWVRERIDPPGAPESTRYAPTVTPARITTTLKEIVNG